MLYPRRMYAAGGIFYADKPEVLLRAAEGHREDAQRGVLPGLPNPGKTVSKWLHRARALRARAQALLDGHPERCLVDGDCRVVYVRPRGWSGNVDE